MHYSFSLVASTVFCNCHNCFMDITAKSSYSPKTFMFQTIRASKTWPMPAFFFSFFVIVLYTLCVIYKFVFSYFFVDIDCSLYMQKCRFCLAECYCVSHWAFRYKKNLSKGLQGKNMHICVYVWHCDNCFCLDVVKRLRVSLRINSSVLISKPCTFSYRKLYLCIIIIITYYFAHVPNHVVCLYFN